MNGECQCPKIDIEEWRDREVSLAGHRFLATPTPLFFHVPRRLYQDVQAIQERIAAGEARGISGPLILHRDGWFSGELLVSIDPESPPRADVRAFDNLFYSRVVDKPGFEGALREMPRFYRDLAGAGVGHIEAMYFWYLSCPKCLVERGAGQTILMARSNRLLAATPCPMEAGGGRQRLAMPCQV